MCRPLRMRFISRQREPLDIELLAPVALMIDTELPDEDVEVRSAAA